MLKRLPHVLVVDDAPGVCALVEAALGDIGMQVSSATTIGQARAILRSGPVDLAIIDVVLAGESGLDIAREATRLGARVLLMSGFANIEAEEIPFPFLAKPFAMRELADVASFLSGAVPALL